MRISSTRNYQTAYGLEVDENTCAGVVGLSRISSILDNGEGRRNQKLAFGDFPFAPSLPPPHLPHFGAGLSHGIATMLRKIGTSAP